jgi:AmmeMemoRadiSam system protein B
MTERDETVRPAAVAGLFYPAEPVALGAAIDAAFAGAGTAPNTPAPKALVVPHAGYQYSGTVAAGAYLRLVPGRETIRRVVLLGPSHRVYVRGLALSTAAGWATPLGVVPLDSDAGRALAHLACVRSDDRPHASEHSLEVQLPFLQTVLADFVLVPIVVGDATIDEVAAVLDALWAGPETVVVVSTDLSHYHRYEDAVGIDARTAAAIATLRPTDVADDDACGARPLRGLLHTAARRQLSVDTIDLRNSGDTAGDRHRVVGYGAFALA